MHPVKAAQKLSKRLEVIEANQGEILRLLKSINLPVKMIELDTIEIPEELEQIPAKKKKEKV